MSRLVTFSLWLVIFVAPHAALPADQVWLPENNPSMTFTLPRSGVNKPAVISEDYKRGICDVLRILYPADLAKNANITVGYDDVNFQFDCSKREP